MLAHTATLASLLVPGLGQLLRARVLDAALYLWAALWLHALCMGAVRASYPAAQDLLAAFGFGAAGVDRGFRVPVLVVLTVIMVFVHVWAARDAGRKDNGRVDQSRTRPE